jgi:hypothetical protein
LWQTAKAREEGIFSGCLIVTANRPLAQTDELEAMKTRIICLHHQPTNEEIAARMRLMASKGFLHEHGQLSPGSRPPIIRRPVLPRDSGSPAFFVDFTSAEATMRRVPRAVTV